MLIQVTFEPETQRNEEHATENSWRKRILSGQNINTTPRGRSWLVMARGQGGSGGMSKGGSGSESQEVERDQSSLVYEFLVGLVRNFKFKFCNVLPPWPHRCMHVALSISTISNSVLSLKSFIWKNTAFKYLLLGIRNVLFSFGGKYIVAHI